MIVTEEEAKTKRCQESFGAHGGYYPLTSTDPNRQVISGTINCIGSACMAWRWGAPQYIYDKEGRPPDSDPGAPWRPCSKQLSADRWSFWVKDAPARGDCGKAGRP